ncbi:glycosyltransferase [Streptomyces sp. PTM05]|uniref:D-inositol 3-phosphate glycosyltransferase n=1 Tax=Streptantibioticus parmotrematis TaxID=2873249 RepID=A0ABS7R161_9ACTN|nr:glycosyltransferase [Streptantibioticus parmotrematis]MBY8889208.1 glycosyltransferase [Streptantibioticus parmotrematis]
MAIALHDGWYSTGTGAGRSNRALITAVADALAPDVRLILLPVRLDPSSPEYDAAGHHRLRERIAPAPHQVIDLDNGTQGRERFGGLDAFRHLTHHAARVLDEVMTSHRRGLLLAIDQPFAGLGPLLTPRPGWRLMYLPRSSADHHDDHHRAAWERDGITGWVRTGAQLGAISDHMRTLLISKGAPATRILAVPGGLTELDRTPLSAAPALPSDVAGEAGFLLSMGRATPYKGFTDLLDALALLATRQVAVPPLLLAAVTDNGEPNTYQHHLRERAAALPLPVSLWTRYDPTLPGLLYHPRLRAVIVPSRTEPLGRIPLEAHAAGAAPVVATTAGGLAETVTDQITGYTAPPANPAALADAIHRALTAPPDTVERLRAAGAALVAARDYTRCITGVLAHLAPWASGAAAANP